MSKVVDALSILLVLGASLAFSVGVAALGERRDLAAIYWLCIGGLVLRAAARVHTMQLRRRPSHQRARSRWCHEARVVTLMVTADEANEAGF